MKELNINAYRLLTGSTNNQLIINKIHTMKKLFILGTFLFISSIPMVSCTDDDDKDPNFMPPDIVMGGGDVESEYPEGFACSRSFCDVYLRH